MQARVCVCVCVCVCRDCFALRVCSQMVKDWNADTSLAKPDLEWSIVALNTLLQALQFATIDPTAGAAFRFGVVAYMGSFQVSDCTRVARAIR